MMHCRSLVQYLKWICGPPRFCRVSFISLSLFFIFLSLLYLFSIGCNNSGKKLLNPKHIPIIREVISQEYKLVEERHSQVIFAF